MACAGACVAGAAGSLVLPAAVKTATAVGTAATAFLGLRSLKRNKTKKTKRNKRNKRKKRKRNTNRKTKQKGGRHRSITRRRKK